MTNPIQAPKRKSYWDWWMRMVFVCATGHIILVFLCYSLLSPSFLAMEGNSNLTWTESLAQSLYIVLSIPLGFIGLRICIYFGLSKFFLFPWILANGLLWAIAISFAIWTIWRARQFKQSVTGSQ